MVLVQVEPVLQAMEDVLGSLTQTLDGRVYVAMGRGLWDFTAREIYEYADELAESKENQVQPPSRFPVQIGQYIVLRTAAVQLSQHDHSAAGSRGLFQLHCFLTTLIA